MPVSKALESLRRLCIRGPAADSPSSSSQRPSHHADSLECVPLTSALATLGKSGAEKSSGHKASDEFYDEKESGYQSAEVSDCESEDESDEDEEMHHPALQSSYRRPYKIQKPKPNHCWTNEGSAEVADACAAGPTISICPTLYYNSLALSDKLGPSLAHSSADQFQRSNLRRDLTSNRHLTVYSNEPGIATDATVSQALNGFNKICLNSEATKADLETKLNSFEPPVATTNGTQVNWRVKQNRLPLEELEKWNVVADVSKCGPALMSVLLGTKTSFW